MKTAESILSTGLDQDCSATIENLLLGAHVLGLGACWLGVHPREQRVKALQEILSVQKSVLPVACIAIGYPAEVTDGAVGRSTVQSTPGRP